MPEARKRIERMHVYELFREHCGERYCKWVSELEPEFQDECPVCGNKMNMDLTEIGGTNE